MEIGTSLVSARGYEGRAIFAFPGNFLAGHQCPLEISEKLLFALREHKRVREPCEFDHTGH